MVEALIERASRLREDMIKSSAQKIATTADLRPLESALYNQNNNNASGLTTHHRRTPVDPLVDDIDPSLDNDNICDMLGIKASLKSAGNLNDSNESILTDLDGLENEQSLLDELLYGGGAGGNDSTHQHPKSSTSSTRSRPPRGKPPTGRSPSPTMARVGSSSNRSRSARSRSLAQSSDSDTASRVSFDMPSSDLDDSGNGKSPRLERERSTLLLSFSESHDEESLSKERLQLLGYVRTARVRIDHLRLNVLMNGRESPSHSSFGRTNKSKRAT